MSGASDGRFRCRTKTSICLTENHSNSKDAINNLHVISVAVGYGFGDLKRIDKKQEKYFVFSAEN